MKRISSRIILLLLLVCIAACNGDNKVIKKKLLDLHYSDDKDVKVWLLNDKYVYYQSELLIDADGSPRAYNPENTGIDDTSYAHKKSKLSPDIIVYENGKPYIQTNADPYPGYYVSQTEMQYLAIARNNYKRYVNSEDVAYISIPANLKKYAFMGDVVLVYNPANKKYSYATIAGSGDDSHIGEGSVKLAQNLGYKIDYKPHVYCKDCNSGVIYIIVKRSTRLHPTSQEEIEQQGKRDIPIEKAMEIINNMQ